MPCWVIQFSPLRMQAYFLWYVFFGVKFTLEWCIMIVSSFSCEHHPTDSTIKCLTYVSLILVLSLGYILIIISSKNYGELWENPYEMTFRFLQNRKCNIFEVQICFANLSRLLILWIFSFLIRTGIRNSKLHQEKYSYGIWGKKRN